MLVANHFELCHWCNMYCVLLTGDVVQYGSGKLVDDVVSHLCDWCNLYCVLLTGDVVQYGSG